MGVRGPVPKRKDQLAGHRSRAELAGATATEIRTGASSPAAPAPTVVHQAKPPAAAKGWHPLADRLWRALKLSQQSAMYDASDWAALRLVMNDLSGFLKSVKRNSQTFAAVIDRLQMHLVTEGSRRRAGIELARRTTPAPAPRALPGWNKDVAALLRAMAKSEHAVFYEPSDWAFAVIVLDEYSRYAVGGPSSNGKMLATIYSALSSLLISEGDRRRIGVETSVATQNTGPTPGQEEVERWQKILASPGLHAVS